MIASVPERQSCSKEHLYPVTVTRCCVILCTYLPNQPFTLGSKCASLFCPVQYHTPSCFARYFIRIFLPAPAECYTLHLLWYLDGAFPTSTVTFAKVEGRRREKGQGKGKAAGCRVTPVPHTKFFSLLYDGLDSARHDSVSIA